MNTKLGRGADATVYAVKWNSTVLVTKHLHAWDSAWRWLARRSGQTHQQFWAGMLNVVETSSPHCGSVSGGVPGTSILLAGACHKEDGHQSSDILGESQQEEIPSPSQGIHPSWGVPALAFLHKPDPVLVHHNLTTNNVLLNKISFVAKVTDFGMSRAVNPSILSKKSSIKGTTAFMPQALQDAPQYDDKLDTFSFGNVVISTVKREWPNPSQPTYPVESMLLGRSELQRDMNSIAKCSLQKKRFFAHCATVFKECTRQASFQCSAGGGATAHRVFHSIGNSAAAAHGKQLLAAESTGTPRAVLLLPLLQQQKTKEALQSKSPRE